MVHAKFRALADLESFILFLKGADWDEVISPEERGEPSDLPLPPTGWINRLIPEQDHAISIEWRMADEAFAPGLGTKMIERVLGVQLNARAE
jgi:hypothetical protein